MVKDACPCSLKVTEPDLFSTLQEIETLKKSLRRRIPARDDPSDCDFARPAVKQPVYQPVKTMVSGKTSHLITQAGVMPGKPYTPYQIDHSPHIPTSCWERTASNNEQIAFKALGSMDKDRKVIYFATDEDFIDIFHVLEENNRHFYHTRITRILVSVIIALALIGILLCSDVPRDLSILGAVI